MRFRRLSALAVASVMSLTLVAVPALAGKPLPTSPLPGAPTPPPVAETQAPAGACLLGVAGTPTGDIGYIIPPDDVYFVLLDPRTCPTCPPGGQVLGSARMSLKFTGACQIPVTVSIVPALEASPGCLEPDREAQPLCGPVEQMISDGGTIGSCLEAVVALPAGCCITGPAFLRVEFDQGTCPSAEPQFCILDACTTCTEYNLFPNSPNLDDLCVVLNRGIIMYADAQCCSTTPTLPGSWGRLKTLYR